MSNKFENDLRDSCKDAARYLRIKHQKYNDENEFKGKERLYRGEREFVAEDYRLLVERDSSYRDRLFIETIRPDKGEESGNVTPDIVYRDGKHEKCVIEVKAIVNNRSDGSALPWKNDSYAIESDYEKLQENYSQFDSKLLDIAYLGDPLLDNGNEFPLADFETWVYHEFLDKEKIKVIVC